jgi:hypothetical protein
VAFKQKIPLAAGAAILAGGVALLVLLARPPAEDRLMAAVRKHAASLGAVRDLQIHGSIADVVLEPGDRCLFLEFDLRDGQWVFLKDLGRDFDQTMRTPERERESLNRLGHLLAERFNAAVKLKEGIRLELRVSRDEYGLAGQYLMSLSFPRPADGSPQRVRYLETFRYRDGRWELEGTRGRLFLETPRGEEPR